MHALRRSFVLAALGLVLVNPRDVFSADTDWPQWRGPLRTGVAPAGDPPTKWSETQNMKWKVKLPGSGTATPIVWQDQVFIHTAIPAGEQQAAVTPVLLQNQQRRGGGGFGGGLAPTEKYQFVLLCLDRGTGRTLWQKVVRETVPHEGHHRDHGFASYSPATDGQVVVSYFGSRGLHCFDMRGNLKWEKDLGRMRTKNGFGEGSSPVLHGDTVVVLWDHEGDDDFIAALDKNSGKELWRTPRDEDTTWSTPLVVEHEGQAQVVVSATRKIRSYDLKTGKLLWECGGMTANAIPSPVAQGDTVYVTSGFRGSNLLAIRLGRQGDLTGGDAIAWSHNRGTPYVPSPLLYDHRLYFFSGNEPRLSCFDVRTGKALYETQRVEELQGVYASPVGAAGRVYLVGRNGTTAVISHADRMEVLATNVLDDRIDASPVVVGKELFLRGHRFLYCIAEK
jgi:outer membrane protein assembly factor BamB